MKPSANKITPRMFYDHAIRREYMSGVSREKSRVKATGEVFTPDGLVVEILEKLSGMDKSAFTDNRKTFLDPSAGDGQFLAHVMMMKIVGGDLSNCQQSFISSEAITANTPTASMEKPRKGLFAL